jgi:hypothetical protein
MVAVADTHDASPGGLRLVDRKARRHNRDHLADPIAAVDQGGGGCAAQDARLGSQRNAASAEAPSICWQSDYALTLVVRCSGLRIDQAIGQYLSFLCTSPECQQSCLAEGPQIVESKARHDYRHLT